MTEITDAEVAEIQWASSEQGKAAVRAAWDKAQQLGLDVRPPSTPAAAMAYISAVVYAAYLAAGWDGEPGGDEPRATAHALLERMREVRGHIEDMGEDERVFMLGALTGALEAALERATP